jgi:hypothetical protein
MREFRLARWWLLLGLVACGGSGGPSSDWHFADGLAHRDADAAPDATTPADVAASDWPDPPDAPPPDGTTCWPGTAYGCAVDGLSLKVCLPGGDGFGIEPCLTATGGQSACLDGRCTPCLPGTRACDGEDRVVRCAEDGQGNELLEECSGATTGKVCFQGACIGLCELSLKWNTYLGCDTWGADLDNAYIPGEEADAMGAPYAIVVSNPHERFPASVTITRWNEALGVEEVVTGEPFACETDPKWLCDTGESDPARPFQAEAIGPGDLRVFYLPRRDVNGTVIAPLAYHVVSSIPVTTYQFNPLANVGVKSNDASLLFPSNVDGTWYYVMSREQTYDYLRGFLAVVAVSPGTTDVVVTVTAPTLAGDVPHLEPGESTGVLKLSRFDVLNIESNGAGSDFTGSVVVASKPVAVFGGLECANAPNTELCGSDGFCEWRGLDGTDAPVACERHEDCFRFITGFCDHLEDQLLPVAAWGKHYLCGKSFDRTTEKDLWRVLAADDGTRFTTLPPQNGGDFPVLNAGEWIEFASDEHFELVADKPVMVGQFFAGWDSPTPGKTEEPGDAAIGDPSFLVQVPTEQFRDQYVFLAPDKYELDYVTLHAPKDAQVVFDGALVEPGLWAAVGTGAWRVARFRIKDGVHRVDASAPVGVYVYGYDFHVSYGYPAGLDLERLNDEPGPSLP